MSLSGPMFEQKESDYWHSLHDKDGGHYNTFSLKNAEEGIAALRSFFPDGECNEYNLVLFSTSGVHGSYTTIEEAEVEIPLIGTVDEYGDERRQPRVTFCLIQPRICTIRCGNVAVSSKDDCDYLRKLRKSSIEVFSKIGQPDH